MALNDISTLLTHFGENLALLLALVLLYSLVGMPLLRRAGRFGAAIASVLFGGIAVLGMQWPIEMVPGYGVDGRNLVIFAAGAFGGPWTGAITAFLVVAYPAEYDFTVDYRPPFTWPTFLKGLWFRARLAILDQNNAKTTGYQFRLILNWERDLI